MLAATLTTKRTAPLIVSLALLTLAAFAISTSGCKGGDEENLSVGHHLEQIRVLVQIRPVLNGVNPGFDGHAKAGAADRVAGHLFALNAGLVHQGVQLVATVGDIHGAMGGFSPTCLKHLDQVRPAPHYLSYLGPDSIDTVREPPRQQRV